jgi:DNA-binding NarL/FixJ family response regulator
VDKITILIADDHPVVRNGLQTMLEQTEDFEITGAVANGRQALAHIALHTPQVALMDLRMPEMDGVQAIHHVRREHPHTHVLILTTYDDETDIFAALDAGATGYLLKDAPKETLIQAIRAAAAGKSILDPNVAAKVMGRTSKPMDSLTAREIEVLQLVAAGNTNDQISERLFISTTTVKTHLKHIFRKLGVPDRAAAVAIAVEKRIISAKGG